MSPGERPAGAALAEPVFPRRIGPAFSGGLAFLCFLLVPLAVSPLSWDRFTSVKWYVLGMLAVAWFLAERTLCAGAGGPAFVKRNGLLWGTLGVLLVASSVRFGLGWAVAPLLARTTFALLALTSFWYFRRNGLRLTALRLPVVAAAVIVIAVGLLQMAGLNPLEGLRAGDGRSVTFGNVNMAAQFLGLALVVLASWLPFSPPRVAAFLEILQAHGLAYCYLLGSRSVALALAAALVFLVGVSRLPWRPFLRVSAGAILVAATVHLVPGVAGPLSAEFLAHKRESTELRLAVWSDSLRLVRDNPLGVGGGNFERAFIPYAVAGRSRPDESRVLRSPHNDYLRLVAEEGMVTAALLAGLVGFLLARLRLCPAVDRWGSPAGVLLGSTGTFLAVEAFFQFPFEMAFPALMAAVMLGLAWACLEPQGEAAPRPGVAGTVASLLVAAGVVWGLGRVAAAEYLFVNARLDLRAQERACALDPRRLEACVQAAWLRSNDGDAQGARAMLVEVLDRSPYYFPAIKLLGEEALARGDRGTGCRHLARYDAMFGGRSSVHDRVLRECPAGR